MAYNDEHRGTLRQLVESAEFLKLMRHAKSTDEMEDIAMQRIEATGVPARLQSIKKLPAGFGGGYRLSFQLEYQGYSEFIDFDPD